MISFNQFTKQKKNTTEPSRQTEERKQLLEHKIVNDWGGVECAPVQGFELAVSLFTPHSSSRAIPREHLNNT